jgi:hypothetical protein
VSANRIFLVCSHHPQLENALCLGERGDGSSVYSAANMKRADEWFAKHSSCGVDTFNLAFHRPQGWDQSPDAQDTVAGGVKLALATTGIVNGSGQ